MTNKVLVEFIELSPLGEELNDEKPIMSYEAPFYPSYHEGETITLEKEDGFIDDEDDDAHHYTIVDIQHSVRQNIRSEYMVKSVVKMKVFLRRT